MKSKEEVESARRNSFIDSARTARACNPQVVVSFATYSDDPLSVEARKKSCFKGLRL